jgi:hypothetical protein
MTVALDGRRTFDFYSIPKDAKNVVCKCTYELEEKKVTTKETQLPQQNYDMVWYKGEALFYVPANATNVRCLYDIKE